MTITIAKILYSYFVAQLKSFFNRLRHTEVKTLAKFVTIALSISAS